jgi:putative radical SAM enzyme (TIGR03279 family)
MAASLKGLRVTSIERGSPAFRAGLRKGDRIAAVAGEPVSDELELRFFSAQVYVPLRYFRGRALRETVARRREGEELGVVVARRPVKKCANACLFCFVDQMPEGLRRSLYIKDEDYRYSFTNGNYITLSRTGPEELEHIALLGLSPLYISVHATIPSVRARLLGSSRAFDIMRQMRFLAEHGIRFHTQIVVCPGINDGVALKKTIADLLSFKEDLLSIAVVPVGLTRHRVTPLAPVTRSIALRLCAEAGRVGDAQVKAQGRRVVFCADELFIKAGLPIPVKSYYEDYPQIENGVGLARQLMEQWRELKKSIKANRTLQGSAKARVLSGAYLSITSVSASSFVIRILRELESFFPGIEIKTAVVPNDFFGRTVTVAGLLSAKDVMHAVKTLGGGRRYTAVFLPDVMFNANGVTLDGFSPRRIERRLNMKVNVISTLSQILEIVRGKQ